jgi:hypothetical protein
MCSSYQAFGFLYGISAILWLLYFTKDPSTDLSGGFIGDEGAMPYISKYNASLVMERRFDEIHRTYSEAMSSHRWKPLRVISGISIEKLGTYNVTLGAFIRCLLTVSLFT